MRLSHEEEAVITHKMMDVYDQQGLLERNSQQIIQSKYFKHKKLGCLVYSLNYIRFCGYFHPIKGKYAVIPRIPGVFVLTALQKTIKFLEKFKKEHPQNFTELVSFCRCSTREISLEVSKAAYVHGMNVKNQQQAAYIAACTKINRDNTYSIIHMDNWEI